MIHVLKFDPCTAVVPMLEGMFEDRKRLFVDLFGWELPVIDGRLEMDQYDCGAVVYIVAASQRGEHEASIRLMPSNRPHMLADLFPYLCPGGVPTDDGTWESSRLCLPQRHGAGRRRELRNLVISAMVDFALANGITRITGIIPESFRKDVLSMGWLAEPLGPIVRLVSGPVGAFAIHVGPDTPTRLGWTGVYVGSEADSAALETDVVAAAGGEHGA